MSDHQILSAVLDSIAMYKRPRSLWPVPPPQNRFKKTLTKEDSLKARRLIIGYINEFRTIGIDTSLVIDIPDYAITENMFKTKDFSPIDKAYDSLLKIKIDIDRIKLKGVKNAIYFDSITYYDPSDHLTKYRSYTNIDYRFNFSNIIYNEEKTRAALRCIYRFEDRYPNGAIFLLEKRKDDWAILKSHFFIGY
ncbi:hypothetical protein [Winogradskyella bathintestinalis]|uniref:Uncharacterized protein n=1 Tax=Winogradskyella bathintestinalis TaxID=3035208 RepID=A0ABT7ZRJ2_9FLAO|nr:hypothetical protein [Winogradskyella bathintestinalis]MDN3491612.1 hypothetical protein [Winogradskyella bathintestinalis]